jgi:hypothetical protein
MEKGDYNNFYGIEQDFEVQEIFYGITKEDYQSMAYKAVSKLDHYDERYCPVDENGNDLISIWYSYEEDGCTYYEYAYQPLDGAPQAYRTSLIDPRDYQDYGILRVDLDFCASSDLYTKNTGADFRNYCDPDDPFELYFDNTTSCCRYILSIPSKDLSEASAADGGYLYFDVCLPAGEYNISIADTPFDSVGRSVSASTLVKNDRTAFATVTLIDAKISGTWHKIDNVFSWIPLLVILGTLLLNKLKKKKEETYEEIHA